MQFFLKTLIAEGRSSLVVLKMFTNDDEILEQDRNLEKMTELATAYFEEDDTQSDTFYPISGINGRIQSQFYPGRDTVGRGLNGPQGPTDIYATIHKQDRQLEG